MRGPFIREPIGVPAARWGRLNQSTAIVGCLLGPNVVLWAACSSRMCEIMGWLLGSKVSLSEPVSGKRKRLISLIERGKKSHVGKVHSVAAGKHRDVERRREAL